MFLFFMFNKLFYLCHYFLELCPPTANELGLLCGSFRFYHKLSFPKKSKYDDDNAFNLYVFCLFGLCCTVDEDVEKANGMILAFEGNLCALLFHGFFTSFRLTMLMMIVSKYQVPSKSPNVSLRRLIIPTGQ